MGPNTRNLIVTVCLVALAIPGFADDGVRSKRKLPAVKLEKAPAIDGTVEAEEWALAPVATPFYDAYTAKPPEHRTEARLGYTDTALYVAFVCHDPDPSKIVATQIQPGSDFNGEDFVVLMLDTYGTRQAGQLSRFLVNALGTTNEEIAGGRANKREWRGKWKAAAKRTPEGYSVEMEIPWAILNYPDKKQQTMDINFIRAHARSQVISRWSDLTPGFRWDYMGFWEQVDPPKPTSTSRVEWLGYAAPEFDEGKSSFRMGFDARYPFTSDLTGVLSVNPDFKNIEGQIAGIEFTRSERFIRDTRPFFTEGGDYFQLTPEYTFGQMFYSQRIPYFDYGVKAFGRADKSTSVGALVAVDTGDSTNAVVKIGKEMGPDHSASLFTAHQDHVVNGTNTLVGHTTYNKFNRWFFETESSTVWDRGTRHGAYAGAVAFSMPRLFSVVRYSKVDRGFRPALGFLPFDNDQGTYWFTEYNNEFRTGPLRRVYGEVFLNDYRHTDGSPFRKEASLSAGVVTNKDMRIGAWAAWDRFEGEASRVFGLNLQFNQSKSDTRKGVSLNHGERGGDKTQFLSVFGNHRLMKRLLIGASTSALNFQGHSTLSVASLSWELDPRRSLSGRWVNRDGTSNFYLAYRNAGFEGMDWYVILGDPNSPKFRERLAIKVVWAF